MRKRLPLPATGARPITFLHSVHLTGQRARPNVATSQPKEPNMAWKSPKIVEIALGAEINSYACAEAKK